MKRTYYQYNNCNDNNDNDINNNNNNNSNNNRLIKREWGWSRDGAAVGGCGLGSTPRPGVTRGLSLLLVLVPTPRVSLWVLQFSSLNKNQHSKFQFDLEAMDKVSHLVECPVLNPFFNFYHKPNAKVVIFLPIESDYMLQQYI